MSNNSISNMKRSTITMYNDKPITEPIKIEKLGKILGKGGEWYDNHTKCDPHDTIEGYVLQVSYDMLQQREETLREENSKLRNHIEKAKKENNTNDEEERKDNKHLNLQIDILRLDRAIKRIDTRMRKAKDTDVCVRCGNVLGLLEGKKLLLIQAVLHRK